METGYKTVLINVSNESSISVLKDKFQMFFDIDHVLDIKSVSDNFYTNYFQSVMEFILSYTDDRPLLFIDSNSTINKKAYDVIKPNLDDFINYYNADVIALGGFRWKTYNADLVGKNLLKINSSLTAHGIYILTNSAIHKIKTITPGNSQDIIRKHIDTYKGFDQFLTHNIFNLFACEPRITMNHSLSEDLSIRVYEKDLTKQYEEIKKFKCVKSKTGYIVFTELQPYFLWQTELFIYSLINNAKINPMDIVVLYSGVTPHENIETNTSYTDFKKMITKYGVLDCYVSNLGKRPWVYRLNNGGFVEKNYGGINKWTSLIEVCAKGLLNGFDEIILLEQDLWCAGKFPELPVGNCVTKNWINNREYAFRNDAINYPGLNLNKILDIFNIPAGNKDKWQPGAIIFKFDKATFTNMKFLKSIVDFTQLIMNIEELDHPEGMRHETDMISPNLALAFCGIDVQLIDSPSLKSDTWTEAAECPEDIVVHYGWTFNNYKHIGADFGKGDFVNIKPWDNIEKVDEWISKSNFKWAKKFFQDMKNIKLS